MAAWHPVDTLRPLVWLFPRPGTKETFAEIRYLLVTLEGERVWRYRAVRVDVETRRLIGAGYFRELDDAAMACHRAATAEPGNPALSRSDAYGPRGTLRA